jgi:hypothetical protein
MLTDPRSSSRKCWFTSAVIATPDQMKIMAELGGADPSLGVRVKACVLAVSQLVNVHAQILPTGIHDPELGNTR